MKECEHFDKRDRFCLKDIDSARVWDCTATDKQRRLMLEKYNYDSLDMDLHCPYPKLGKD